MITLAVPADTVAESVTELTRIDLASILLPAVFTFAIGLIISPIILKFLIKAKFWRQQKNLRALGGGGAPITQKLNNDRKLKTPRMGGLVIIIAVALTTFLFGLISKVSPEGSFIHSLNFISREETYLVIFSLIAGALIGILDDLAVVGRLNFKLFPAKFKQYVGGGLSLKIRLLIATLIGCVCGYWFYFKLGETALYLPFGSILEVGIWIIPIMILVVIATYSGGIIDGVDGLSGGVFISIFTVYAVISLLQGNFELATFCFVVIGGLLAFLWHNIPPAKFFMTETGSMALTITLSIIAFITDTVVLLPIIALPLAVTTLSVIIQIITKRYTKRKFLKVAPLHNHFRAKGYPDYNVTMRYWVVSHIVVFVGLVIYLLGYPNILLK